MDLRLAVPDELDDYERKEALNAALESCTRSVTGLVRRGVVPPAAGMIKAGRVRWQAEPPGAEHFDLPGTVIRRGWGDCDDLGPWHAGSLRAAGIDPGARAIVKKSGPKRWHCIVQRSDGSIEDPSAHAGMNAGVSGGGVVGAGPAMHTPMSAEGRMCLAICPSRDRRHPLIWFARCDVPDKLEPWDWSSAAAHKSPKDALLHAIKTVRHVAGEEIDPEDDARLAALCELVCGADPEDVADELAELVHGEDPDDVELDGEGDEKMDVDQVVDDAVQSVGFLDALTRPFKAAARFVAPVTRPLANVYSAVSPYTAALFPGSAQLADTLRAAATGDPMAVYKSRLMPGTQSARDVFERNPLGRTAFAALHPLLQNIPGGAQWLQASAPRQGAPGAPAPAAAADLLSLLSSMGPGTMPPMQVPQMPGWAPATFGLDPGAVFSQGGGPAFMRF